MSVYTKKEILDKCKEAIKGPKSFYNKKFINYLGRTSDTKEYYTEIVADFLYKNENVYENGIKTVYRKRDYLTKSHTGKYKEKDNGKLSEENLAKKLFSISKGDSDDFDYKNFKSFDFIGKIIDYQTPLKAGKLSVKSPEKGVGKIDLLSYDEKSKCLRILELKKEDNSESMLRCVLEAYTYLKMVDQNKLKKEFSEKLKESYNVEIAPNQIEIKASPFVFVGGVQYNQMENSPRLKELMKKLDITPYYIAEENNGYKVVDK